MANKVTEKLQELLESAKDTHVVMGRHSYPLDHPDLPVNAGVTFVTTQLQALRPPKKVRAATTQGTPVGAGSQ